MNIVGLPLEADTLHIVSHIGVDRHKFTTRFVQVHERLNFTAAKPADIGPQSVVVGYSSNHANTIR